MDQLIYGERDRQVCASGVVLGLIPQPKLISTVEGVSGISVATWFNWWKEFLAHGIGAATSD